MSFISRMYPGEPVYDDNNSPVAELGGKGREARNYDDCPFGSMPHAAAFDESLLIPKSEWDDRIKEQEETNSRLSDIRLQARLPSLSQGSTNYCWTNAVISAMMVMQAKQGGIITPLSAASVAAPIKGFRNQGGWGGEALEYIVANGVAPVADWPANAIDRKYDNATSKANRVRFKIIEWWDLASGRFDQMMSMLLRRIPVPIGLNWWRHEVCALDPVKLGANAYGVRIWNSWGDDYGSQGMATLTQSKSTADDQCAPRAQFT